MRLFIAIQLSDGIRDGLSAVQRDLRDRGVRGAGFHRRVFRPGIRPGGHSLRSVWAASDAYRGHWQIRRSVLVRYSQHS